MTFVHFITKPFRTVILSVAKNLYLRPFASLRVTSQCANLVWFDLVPRVRTKRFFSLLATDYFYPRHHISVVSGLST
jgi:hypothetical protein